LNQAEDSPNSKQQSKAQLTMHSDIQLALCFAVTFRYCYQMCAGSFGLLLLLDGDELVLFDNFIVLAFCGITRCSGNCSAFRRGLHHLCS